MEIFVSTAANFSPQYNVTWFRYKDIFSTDFGCFFVIKSRFKKIGKTTTSQYNLAKNNPGL